MSPPRIIHLSGPRRGEIDPLVDLPATIGSDPRAQVVIADVAPQHAVVFQKNGDFVLQDGGSEQGTFLGGEMVHEAMLRDGDVLELGSGGPKLRFRHEEEHPVPLLQALKWARPAGAPDRLSDTTDFLGAFVRETSLRTSRAFRLALLAIALGTILLFTWSQREANRLQQEVHNVIQRAEAERKSFQERIDDERRRAEMDHQALEKRIEEYRQREETLRHRLAEAASGEVQELKNELSTTRGRLETIESERASGERIIAEYGAGVCLIQGSYAFFDSTGKPLRTQLDETGHSIREDDGSPLLSPTGTGSIHSIEYIGTGFLVDRRGWIVTNRHVAEPWWNDSTAENLTATGFAPRFLHFRAFFPKEREPYPLELERLSDSVDLALLRINLKGRKVPILPLDITERGAVAGQPVVVVGYPTGLEAILAKADAKVVREILGAHGTSSEHVTEALSQKGLIRPSTTQGHIGDITKTDIVFDAPTTQGGSGGPVFNKSGQVIAVEYAVLPKFGGNSFGLPVRYVVALMNAKKKSLGSPPAIPSPRGG